MLQIIDDDGWYRISDTKGYAYNDGAWLGYNGIGYFSSCYHLKLMDFMGSMGENQTFHNLFDKDRSSLMESLLGARYRLSYAGRENPYDVIGSQGFYAISENPDALSLGYMMRSDQTGTAYPELKKNVFENQNTFVSDLCGTKMTVFEDIPYEAADVTDQAHAKKVQINARAEKAGEYWIYFEWVDRKTQAEYALENADEKNAYMSSVDDVGITVNGAEKGEFINDLSCYAVCLGTFQEGENLFIEARSTQYFGDSHIAYFNEAVYQEALSMLRDHQWQLTKHENGSFVGTVDAGDGGTFFLTLPYEKGWEVTVDGERRDDLQEYRDVFLTLPLQSGVHEVEIRFVAPGFWIGLIAGLISILLTIMYLNQPMNRRKEDVR